jgi:hypothetical protein
VKSWSFEKINKPLDNLTNERKRRPKLIDLKPENKKNPFATLQKYRESLMTVFKSYHPMY